MVERLKVFDNDAVAKVLSRVKEKYNRNNVEQLINNIDINVPSSLSMYKLSSKRKQLMIKIITLRIEKLLA